MLQKADIRDVTYADLLALKENQIPESHTLDYKREFPADRDARTSLACDVVAFANTRGGDLVIGVQEEQGIIANIKPIDLTDRDASLLTLQSALTDLIEPKVPGIRLHAVPVPTGGYIVICRTPPSFQAPHRVRKTGVFYTRTSTGIDPMDITTLRSAFLQSAAATEKAKQFRERRMLEVRETPRTPFKGGALGVLHVAPMASVLGGVSFDTDTLYPVAQKTPPPVDFHFGPRVNFDGVMSACDTQDETYGYTQIFRDGCIESVMPIQADKGDVAWINRFRETLTNQGHHTGLVEALVRLGLDGPAFVMLSFIDIGGAPLENPRQFSSHIYGKPAVVPPRYANLMVPELFVDSFTTAAADIYTPLFDLVWNAAGRRGSPR
ncbi:AlbA family DNA-binding domain-containing protein [Burkholderia cenocepacia]|uniref:AlbA family DNA-binding domain-containing protein n=1 Tax=Burkholderia cenocepacia TaxID=95486 RepID=UPI00286261E1|nr:ATP-binding protein [Burkholderia cenocepacia]MDR8049516.1 ATP-binding protein [Burkholderia cenocepacia]MDV3098252.1 ATP-binding protein [Burkholderia cenocepacia]